MKNNWKKHEKLWIFLAGLLIGALLTGIFVFTINKLQQAAQPAQAGRTEGSMPEGTALGEQTPGSTAPEIQSSSEETQSSGGEETESSTGQQETEPGGTDMEYTLWTKDGIYLGGDEVLYENGIFRARWWTQGETPDRKGEGVWEYLGDLPEKKDRQEDTSADKDKNTPDKNTGDKNLPNTGGGGSKKPNTEGGMKVVAYYPSWKEGDADIEKLRFDIVTHVNYAFAIPTSEGDLRPLENPKLAEKIIQKAHDNGAKALIAVGGWSYQDVPLENTFVEATNTDEKIRKFGDAIVKLCEEYGFDGVDMDWEHPRVDGPSKEQYEKLMVYLGEKLHEKGKLLTSAVLSGVTADGLVYYDSAAHTDTVLNTVDWLNVMAYDGGDGERHSGYDFAVNCAQYWKEDRGLDKSKVVLGVPFYGRPSWAAYDKLLESDADAWKKDVTDYNGMEAWYNGMDTIAKKTAYAKENLGGVMIWEITQDTADREKSLLSAIGQQLQ